MNTRREGAIRTRLIAHQRAWAEAANLACDERSYLPSYGANLRTPLSSAAMAAFKRGSGSELRDGKRRPAKMRALHSSSALVANVFDYWSSRDPAPLLRALGLGPAHGAPKFEAQFPTGLEGEPPNLDLAIQLRSGETVAIESKLCEWMTPKSPAKPAFKAKYFAPVPDLWGRAGLPECQRLADALSDKRERFVYLDAPQLLKHALGLGTQLRGHFSLWYLYFDWPSLRATNHREEVDRFAARVGLELRFRSLTYQELFDSLVQACGAEDRDYIEYLRLRYFGRTER